MLAQRIGVGLGSELDELGALQTDLPGQLNQLLPRQGGRAASDIGSLDMPEHARRPKACNKDAQTLDILDNARIIGTRCL